MSETFGQMARRCATPRELLDLENSVGNDGLFSAIDTLVAGLVIRALRGETIIEMKETDRGPSLRILGMPDVMRASMREAFRLEAQQSRGAWFLPADVSVNAEWVAFPAHFRREPRYAHTLAHEVKGKIELSANPDGMVTWAILQPLFAQLLAPIRLRTEKAGSVSKQDFTSEWESACAALERLGLNVTDVLAPMAWGNGWGRRRAQQQMEAKESYLESLRQQVHRELVLRFRASVIANLIAQYYSKAKNGRAKRKAVLTKHHTPALAGFFGGSWLEFLKYLGEQPHDEERILTSAPEPRLVVEGRSKAAEIASKKGLPLQEVEKILGTYWQAAGGNSPVLERVGVLSDYWSHFQRLHAEQRPGMRPLWGLVEDSPRAYLASNSSSPYQDQLYCQLLPAGLLAKIDRFWSTTVLSKWPDCIVSEPCPHAQMAATFGPALKFWNGCYLTAWFVCEGPMSRTDVPGIAAYFRRELAELEDIGCPVERKIFEELNAVRLGREEAIYAGKDEINVGFGLSVGIQMSVGTRRKGFEKLRDVITRHLQAWSVTHLTAYIRSLWERELKAAGRQFHLMTEEKGKDPTFKQFAKHAIEPARHWFGGDVGLLYAALGQKLSVVVRRSLRMPSDRRRFIEEVFHALGGKSLDSKIVVATDEDRESQSPSQDRFYALQRLASDAVLFVQLSEATGRTPALKEFGNRFEPYSKHIAESTEAAWNEYVLAIESVIGREEHAGRSQ